MARTINIQITNYSGVQLTFQNAQTTAGPAAVPSAPNVANGATFTVTAANPALLGGNQGTFDLSDNVNVTYTIAYTHPQGPSATTVTLQAATAGFNAGVGQAIYAGDPVTATMNLYAGVPVVNAPNPNGLAVPLAVQPYTQPNNCQDFANSMFGPNMRSPVQVTGAYAANPPIADFTGGQMAATVAALQNCWTNPGGAGAPVYNGANAIFDKALVNFLSNYIASGPDDPIIDMWVPTVTYQNNTPAGAAVYLLQPYVQVQLANYVAGALAWQPAGVQNFLEYLLAGAHFVAISATRDFTNQGLPNTGRDLYKAFGDFALPQSHDPMNSHYAGPLTYNSTGQYYLAIEEDYAPPGCGLLLALLFGKTVNTNNAPSGTYNTFMQLEGWPTVSPYIGTRHGADYAAHTQTLWNISTFGASPYSEKRATTIFLAPRGWQPQLYDVTRMMPYVGAYATGAFPNGQPQGWFNPALVNIPLPALQLPARYYV